MHLSFTRSWPKAFKIYLDILKRKTRYFIWVLIRVVLKKSNVNEFSCFWWFQIRLVVYRSISLFNGTDAAIKLDFDCNFKIWTTLLIWIIIRDALRTGVEVTEAVLVIRSVIWRGLGGGGGGSILPSGWQSLLIRVMKNRHSTPSC